MENTWSIKSESQKHLRHQLIKRPVNTMFRSQRRSSRRSARVLQDLLSAIKWEFAGFQTHYSDTASNPAPPTHTRSGLPHVFLNASLSCLNVISILFFSRCLAGYIVNFPAADCLINTFQHSFCVLTY